MWISATEKNEEEVDSNLEEKSELGYYHSNSFDKWFSPDERKGKSIWGVVYEFIYNILILPLLLCCNRLEV